MSHPNSEVISRFYEAFGRRDAEAMAACYADDVTFSDPAFPDLRGRSAGDMWRMLCEAGKDLTIEPSEISANDETGSARWIARYTFSATGNKVVNDVRASFRFKNGRIVEHKDVFDFRVWSKQALGMMGLLFGGTGWLQRQVQGRAAKGLASFQRRRAGA